MNKIEKILLESFNFLSELGFFFVGSKHQEMPLIGRVFIQVWKNVEETRTIKITYRDAPELRPAVLSILIESPFGSFTYTDWVHFFSEPLPPPAPTKGDQLLRKSYIIEFSQLFYSSIQGRLGIVLAGVDWASVPTYRGVNA